MVAIHLDLSVFTVMLGTLGLGLGLGLQPVFVNFISGVMMMFERHVKVGDVIEVGSVLGTVTRINTRSTVVKSFDNIDIIVPNSHMITEQVTNWSLEDRRIRGRMEIGVAYGSDPKQVMEILQSTAEAHPEVQDEPEPHVWFTDFADNALMFTLLIWTDDLSKRMDALTDIRIELDKRFKEAGIDIPFPQRTISMINDQPLRVEMISGEGSMRPSPEKGRPPADAPETERPHHGKLLDLDEDGDGDAD